MSITAKCRPSSPSDALKLRTVFSFALFILLSQHKTTVALYKDGFLSSNAQQRESVVFEVRARIIHSEEQIKTRLMTSVEEETLQADLEQPIFSARAHVFQIDPTTKRKWLPASKHAVTVSFFYDNSRNVYRIISVGGTKFAEQFRELKEAARLAREKSQERYELSNPALGVPAPQVKLSQGCSALSEERQSPPLLKVNGPEEKLFRSKSAEVELTVEKERVKKIPSEGSMCELNLEAELFTLQDSNAKLVEALHEANSSVEQWKRQLQEYQEETDRLREQVAELETQLGRPAQSGTEELSRSLEELEALLSAKNQDHTSPTSLPVATLFSHPGYTLTPYHLCLNAPPTLPLFIILLFSHYSLSPEGFRGPGACSQPLKEAPNRQ
ncbi:hypothetical protein WMY93_024255 [Mugilogobius chulae]|uniref:WH1 domain-containing protein n=1 Tax=Mugilogobius chulae TaxID=88201 RepID=A0AAW0N9E6_9GOBI